MVTLGTMCRAKVHAVFLSKATECAATTLYAKKR